MTVEATTSRATASVWYAVPAVWVQVWVVLDQRGLGQLDPLEDATVRFVRRGITDTRQIARFLHMPEGLVNGAIDHLVANGTLTRLDDGGLALADPDTEPAEDPTTTYDAWMCWDPQTGRLLPQVVLDKIPDSESEPPEGWSLQPLDNNGVGRLSRPKDRTLETNLSWLPSTGNLTVVRHVGQRLIQEASVSSIRRLQLHPSRSKKDGVMWVPVEHRPHGIIIRGPSVAPVQRPTTRLEVGGYESLERRLSTAQRDAAQQQQTRAMEEIAPWLLDRLGFATLDELNESVARDAKRELGPAWPTLSADAREAILAAMRGEQTARASEGDWRSVARGWADVLEVVTLQMRRAIEGRIPDIEGDSRKKLKAATRRAAFLAPTADAIKQHCHDDAKRKDLCKSFHRDADSLGHRILALGIVTLYDDRLANALRDASANHIHLGLFPTLDLVNKDRNTIIHRREHAAEVDPNAFRRRTLAVARVIGTTFPSTR